MKSRGAIADNGSGPFVTPALSRLGSRCLLSPSSDWLSQITRILSLKTISPRGVFAEN